MLLKCERCGAPLEVPAGGSVRCGYCGTTATSREPPPRPPNYGPAHGHGHGHPGFHPQPHHVPSGPQHKGVSATRIVLTATLVAAVSVSAGVIPRILSNVNSTAVQKALSNV